MSEGDVVLRHEKPNCTGLWVEVSMRRLRAKDFNVSPMPKLTRVIRCPSCKAFYPNERPYRRALYEQHEEVARTRQAMVERQAERWIERAIRQAGTDDTEELAAAAMAGLQDGFFRVSKDLGRELTWQHAVRDHLRDTTKAVTDALEGAFVNWRIQSFQAGHRGGEVRYVVELERREPGQEVAVEAKVQAIEPEPPYTDVLVDFVERGVSP